MSEQNCNCENCVHIEQFKTITRSYEGTENDVAETVVDNDLRTVEVKLKPQQYASKAY